MFTTKDPNNHSLQDGVEFSTPRITSPVYDVNTGCFSSNDIYDFEENLRLNQPLKSASPRFESTTFVAFIATVVTSLVTSSTSTSSSTPASCRHKASSRRLPSSETFESMLPQTFGRPRHSNQRLYSKTQVRFVPSAFIVLLADNQSLV